MNIELTNKLSEQWRDVLCAYVTHHILPHKLQAGSLNIITADHLNSYFMMDTQVSTAVTTSYLAEALACVQTYINAVLNSTEPGYNQKFDPKVVTFWQQAMSHYSLWAGYQMLEDYPENYIRADLRMDKTQLFRMLENDLAQGKISDAAVQSALLTWLAGYEFQNSIQVQSGYIDYIGRQADNDQFDGYAFVNSDYYLLGKDTAWPPKYYWRKVAVRLDKTSEFIQPDAWTEWQEITMPADGPVILARLVMFCGRLHLIWLNHGEPLDRSGSAAPNHFYPLKLSIAWLGLDYQWSTPEVLWRDEVSVDKSKMLDTSGFKLLALAIDRARGSDDQLLIVLRDDNIEQEEQQIRFSVQRDVLKRQSESSVTLPAEAHNRLFTYFADNTANSITFQYRLASSDRVLKGIVPHPENTNPWLWLEAVYQERNNVDHPHQLQIRGRSGEVAIETHPLSVYLSRYFELTAGNWLKVDIRTNNEGELELRCTASSKPFQFITLSHPAVPDTQIFANAFKETNYGWFEAKALLDGTALAASLVACTPQAIREGAEFSIKIDDGSTQRIENASNFIVVQADSVRQAHVTLKMQDTVLWTGVLTFNGAATTPWIDVLLPAADLSPLAFTFGPNGNESTFTLMWEKLENDSQARPQIERQQSGTDFIVFSGIAGLQITAVRLNSQHIPDLINRAQASPQAVFSWDAQHQQEPQYIPQASRGKPQVWLRSEDDPLPDLYDANGLYLRELFFHVPHMIASRLQEEERFEEARAWLALIFNPQQKQQATEHPGSAYWNCAFLLQQDNRSLGLEHQLIDPHVIALHAPSHYRKAIFMQYVHLLTGEADWHYRTQSRDGLAKAWLLYRMAAELMGEAPEARTITRWQPVPVAALLEQSGSDKQLLSQADTISPANLPKQLSTLTWIGAAAHPVFRLPVNEHLMDSWRLLSQRFYNLRHYLTIDGSPLQLPLYSPVVNPFDLLLARNGGSGGMAHLLGHSTVVPPYRFRTLVMKAQEAVGVLIQFSDQLRNFMEMQDRTDLEALQYKQASEIAEYTIGIQQQLYEQQKKNEQSLSEQRRNAMLRQTHYDRLYTENISSAEIKATDNFSEAKTFATAAGGLHAAAAGIRVGLNIVGMASGGMDIGAALMSAGYGTDTKAQRLARTSELGREAENYGRRREEWKLQLDMATQELALIDRQIEAQTCATLAAENTLLHSRQVLKQTQDIYRFYQNKSTNVSLYRWLHSQTATLCATLFDVASSLCRSAEACWQFETGNFDKRIMRTPVWQADRYGLNAGSELRLDLHRLESELLLRNERHLELVKTVSLKSLIENQLVWTKDARPVMTWSEAADALKTEGVLTFRLSETLFNRDYPGHYMRRLHSVTVSFPALLGPYQNIRATLMQKQSQLLIKPDVEGVKFLSPELMEEDEQGNGRNVIMSLRPRQQICLSAGSQDMGLFGTSETDDRYLPFEGTGAVSDWQLQFPRHHEQRPVLESLSDIIVEVRYFAKYGGAQFDAAVDGLLNDRLPPLLN